jgi:hypothetical protein
MPATAVRTSATKTPAKAETPGTYGFCRNPTSRGFDEYYHQLTFCKSLKFLFTNDREKGLYLFKYLGKLAVGI